MYIPYFDTNGNLKFTSTQNVLWAIDGNGNIGAINANRPASIYGSGQVLVGPNPSINFLTNQGPGTAVAATAPDSSVSTAIWSTEGFGAAIGFFRPDGFFYGWHSEGSDISNRNMSFWSNNQDLIKFDNAGNITWYTDGVGNIGATTINRPGNVYVANSIHINGNDASSCLEATSTVKGFLEPRMTTTQRNAIASPTEGLQIYNTTTHEMEFYNGTVWSPVTGGANTFLSNLTSPIAVNQNFLFAADNTYTIGATSTSRPSEIFASRLMQAGSASSFDIVGSGGNGITVSDSGATVTAAMWTFGANWGLMGFFAPDQNFFGWASQGSNITSHAMTFYSGGDKLKIDSSANITWINDNIAHIGSHAASRPANLYVGTYGEFGAPSSQLLSGWGSGAAQVLFVSNSSPAGYQLAVECNDPGDNFVYAGVAGFYANRTANGQGVGITLNLPHSGVYDGEDVYLGTINLDGLNSDFIIATRFNGTNVDYGSGPECSRFTASGSLKMMRTSAANILWNTDGAGDIGSPDNGTTFERPNNSYFKGGINVGTSATLPIPSIPGFLWAGDTSTVVATYMGANTTANPGQPDGQIAFFDGGSGFGPTLGVFAGINQLVLYNSGDGGGPFGGYYSGIIFDMPNTPSFNTVNILFGADGTSNIGAVAASRPANIYVSTSIHINGNDTSACLEATSVTQGFLEPRMTNTQRDAIASPSEGLQVYSLTDHEMQVYDGTAWVSVDSNQSSNKIIHPVGSTTGTGFTTIAAIPLPNDSTTYLLIVEIAGRKSGGGKHAAFEIAGNFDREGAGANQNGATVSLVSINTDDATYAVQFAVSGNNVLVQAHGNNVVAETVNWQVVSDFTQVS